LLKKWINDREVADGEELENLKVLSKGARTYRSIY